MPLTIAIPIGVREPIGEFESLVTTIQEHLDREDLTKVQVGNIIALAEASINRRLRANPVPQMETVLNIVTTGVDIGLPDDFLKIRAIRPASDCINLAQTAPFGGAAPISPAYYTVVNKKLRFARQLAPDQAIEIIYYAALPGVNENMPDNWLLNEYPDIYLHGCLASAEAFIANDERVGMWRSMFDQGMAELIEAGNRARYGNGPLVPRGAVNQVRGGHI